MSGTPRITLHILGNPQMAREHRSQSPCRVATPHHHHAWHPGGSDLGPWSPDRLTSAPLGPSGCQSYPSDYRLKSLSRCSQRVYQSYFRGKQCDVKASLVAQTVKNLSAMQQTQVQSPGWEDSPREGNGYPLQYSCLENSLDRGAWSNAGHGVSKSWDTTEQLTHVHTHTHTHTHTECDVSYLEEGESHAQPHP